MYAPGRSGQVPSESGPKLVPVDRGVGVLPQEVGVDVGIGALFVHTEPIPAVARCPRPRHVDRLADGEVASATATPLRRPGPRSRTRNRSSAPIRRTGRLRRHRLPTRPLRTGASVAAPAVPGASTSSPSGADRDARSASCGAWKKISTSPCLHELVRGRDEDRRRRGLDEERGDDAPVIGRVRRHREIGGALLARRRRSTVSTGPAANTKSIRSASDFAPGFQAPADPRATGGPGEAGLRDGIGVDLPERIVIAELPA